AFFAPALFRRDVPIATAEQRRAHATQLAKYQTAIKPATAALSALEAPYRQKLHDARLARLADEARAAHQTPPEQRTTAQRELVEKTNRLLTITPKEVIAAMPPADRDKQQQLQQQIKQFDKLKAAPLPVAM